MAESGPTPSVDCNHRADSSSLDLTSRLPDAIIQHILSFLPTKQAVATCILSKRWRYLWTLVPCLEFDNSMADASYDGHFSDLVNNVLRLHRAVALEKFHLKCIMCGDSSEDSSGDSSEGFSEIELWIDLAVQRRPREFKLVAWCNPFRLPVSVFNCRNIAVLKLEGEGILVDVGDSSVQLPCLKVLRLLSIRNLNDKSLVGLLSGCPALEEFHFRRVDYYKSVTNLCINVPTLRRLFVACLTTTVDKTPRYNLDIKAPALQYLQLLGVHCLHLLLDEFPELVVATLDFYVPLTGQQFAALRRVKHLSLHNRHIYTPQKAPSSFPVYLQLVHLEFALSDSLWVVLMDLLENSPNLKALILFTFQRDLRWPSPMELPNCVLNQLETFSILGFTCSAGEIKFMRHILEKAETLRRVNILTYSRDSKAKLSLLEQFSTFPKRSNGCQIEII